MADLSVSEIKNLLVAQCPGLLHELVPGMRREGNVFSAPNPTRPEGRKSFKLWAQGAFREYDEDEATGKGDILGLIAYVNGYAPRSKEGKRFAVQWAKQRLGLSNASPRAIAAAQKQASETSFKAQQEEEARQRRIVARVLEICDGSIPLHMDDRGLVARYFEGRKIGLAKIEHFAGALLLHPDLRHWSLGDDEKPWRGPAMVGLCRNAGGRVTGVHCTFLAEIDGAVRKAPVSKAKLMLGVVQGAVVPISLGAGGYPVLSSGARENPCRLIICEGIETGGALAEAVPEARVWAALSLGNIRNVPFDDPDLRAAFSGVVVALENDTKAQALKQREAVLVDLRARCAAVGLALTTMIPTRGNDFADLAADDGEE